MEANKGERVKILKRPNGDYLPKDISGKKTGNESERVHPFYLVEPMQYLFVKIREVHGLTPPSEGPIIRVGMSSQFRRSKPTSYRPIMEPDILPGLQHHRRE